MDVSEKSVVELKALAFDELKKYETARANLELLTKLLEQKEKEGSTNGDIPESNL